MQLAVIEVTNRQIAPQLLQYFSEVQSFVRKLSCQRPLAHSQTASNVFQRWSRFAGQFGGLAKVDSGFDYAANFSSFACLA